MVLALHITFRSLSRSFFFSSLYSRELAVKVAVERDKTLAFQAILVDSLTRVLLIDQVRNMVEEMIQAEAEYLQGFKITISNSKPG
ncbi:MAG: hypothetical protein QXI39_09310 [Candidatus Bathyarchaeia archaeon]